MSERTVIVTEGAPKPFAGAPYNQAVRAGRFVFCAGQVGLDPASGTLVEGGVEAQTRRVMQNLAAVLAGGRVGPRPRGQDHDLRGRPRRLRGCERGVRIVLHRRAARALDRAGGRRYPPARGRDRGRSRWRRRRGAPAGRARTIRACPKRFRSGGPGDPLAGVWATVQTAAGETPAYAVGGPVRDLLRGDPHRDADVAVEGDAVAVARRLATAIDGARLTVHSAFGTAVIVAARRRPRRRRRDAQRALPGTRGASAGLTGDDQPRICAGATSP